MSTTQNCPVTQGFLEAPGEIGDRLDRARFRWTCTTARQTPPRDTNADDWGGLPVRCLRNARLLHGIAFAQRPVHNCGLHSKAITCDAGGVPRSR
jgi:hypothetical protein